jgi:hypothetical protein
VRQQLNLLLPLHRCQLLLVPRGQHPNQPAEMLHSASHAARSSQGIQHALTLLNLLMNLALQHHLHHLLLLKVALL